MISSKFEVRGSKLPSPTSNFGLRTSNLVWPVRAGVFGIIVLYTLFVALYATRTPPWQVPDEPAHFNNVRTIADTGTLPVLAPGDYDGPYLETLKARHFPPELSVAPVRYESYQPPLYYALLAALRRLGGGAGLPADLLYLRLASGLGGSLLL